MTSTPNPPSALTAAPQHLGKSKLPYTMPYVIRLTTPNATHGKRVNTPIEAGGIYAASVGS